VFVRHGYSLKFLFAAMVTITAVVAGVVAVSAPVVRAADAEHGATPSEVTAAKAAEEHAAQGEGSHTPNSEHGDAYDLGHANAGAQIADPMEWKSNMAIYTFVVFVLRLMILGKFAWGPICEGLDKREQGIADTIEAAKQLNQEAETRLAEHQKLLDGAADEVRTLLEQGRRDAERQKQTILEEAQQAAQAEKHRALREIKAAKNDALSAMAHQSVDAAIDLAGQIVQSQLNEAEHSRLVQEALQHFPSEN